MEELIAGRVERRRWGSPEAASALSKDVPVVLCGCPLISNLVGRWTFSHLSQVAFDGSEQLSVHIAPVTESDASSFERVYATGLNQSPQCDVQKMAFAEFVDALEPEMSHAQPSVPAVCRHYCSAPLLRARHADGCSDGDALRGSFECCYTGAIGDEATQLIDWEWLAAAQASLPLVYVPLEALMSTMFSLS